MNNASVHFFINTDKEERGGEEGLKGVWLGGDWLPPQPPRASSAPEPRRTSEALSSCGKPSTSNPEPCV